MKRSAELSRRGAIAFALACLAAVLGCEDEKPPALLPQDLVLTGVTIVDTRTGALSPGRTIVVEDGKIAEIASGAFVREGETTVDGRGRFVVPGYLDMHAHPMQSDPERSLTMMLAHGITGFRQMAATPDLLELRRSGEPLSAADAPALLAMPGIPLVGVVVRSPEDAVAEVREQQAMGVDFIKVANLEPNAFFAALAEAKRVGLPFVGHLPATVSPVDAAKAGMRSIEHLGPSIGLLLGCSTEEAELRLAVARLPSMEPPAVLPRFLVKLAIPLFEGFLEKFIANPMLHADAPQIELIRRTVDTYSEEKCGGLAGELARDGVWQVPTLIRIRTMQFGGDPAYAEDPNLRFVASDTRALWASLARDFHAKFSAADRETFARTFELQKQLVKLFDRSGVKMMAGSDMGGAQWIVAGIGLHQEFDLLEESGIAPLAVLRMTTLDGAIFLGRESTMGTVEVGKDADLVMLARNPVESVQNLHAIEGVVRAGRYYSRDALDALKASAAAP
jgi:hypothetical protein